MFFALFSRLTLKKKKEQNLVGCLQYQFPLLRKGEAVEFLSTPGFQTLLARLRAPDPGSELLLLLSDVGQKPWVEEVLSSVTLKPGSEQRKWCQKSRFCFGPCC